MVRNKSYLEEPFTAEELEAIKNSHLIDSSHTNYALIRFATYKNLRTKIIFRFSNKYGICVVREAGRKTFDILPLNQAGFEDTNTPLGWYKTCWSAANVMDYITQMEKKLW